MSKKVKKLTDSFIVTAQDGTSFQIREFTEYYYVSTISKSDREEESLKTFKTTEGYPITRIDDSHFKIFSGWE